MLAGGLALAACSNSLDSLRAAVLPPAFLGAMVMSTSYRQQFTEARNDPALVKGREIPGLQIDCRRMKLRPTDGRYSGFTLGDATGNNDGYFHLDVSDRTIRGRADRFIADNPPEEVFVLSEVRFTPNLRPGSLTPGEVVDIANFIQSLRTACKAAPWHVQTYVLYRH